MTDRTGRQHRDHRHQGDAVTNIAERIRYGQLMQTWAERIGKDAIAAAEASAGKDLAGATPDEREAYEGGAAVGAALTLDYLSDAGLLDGKAWLAHLDAIRPPATHESEATDE